MTILILPAQPEHADGVMRLDALAYDYGDALLPADDPYGGDVARQHFLAHVRVFPEGQFVAIDERTVDVVGRTASMRCHYDRSQPLLETWSQSTGDGWLTTHQADGDWLYGVDTGVHPAYQGRGIGKRLMNARFDVIKRLNLKGLIAGSLIVGYGAVADQVTPEQYVQDVINGRRFDNNLSKQLKSGFRALNVIPHYVPDPRSHDYAVAIVWENPDYTPLT